MTFAECWAMIEDMLRSKTDLMRKSYNSARPINSVRFVITPSAMPANVVELPDAYVGKGIMIRRMRSGRFETMAPKKGMYAVFGRCPSTGPERALPARIVRGKPGCSTGRLGLGVCKVNNADFDGDGAWGLLESSDDGAHQIRSCFEDPFPGDVIGTIDDEILPSVAAMDLARSSVIVQNPARSATTVPNTTTIVDATIYTTIDHTKMINVPWRKEYDLIALNHSSWSASWRATFFLRAQTACIAAFEEGIIAKNVCWSQVVLNCLSSWRAPAFSGHAY